MGTPWFHLGDLAKAHGILGMSSNYELYNDMSNRFHEILGSWAQQEIYSIDESWLDFSDQPRVNSTATGHAIKDQVCQWLGLPHFGWVRSVENAREIRISFRGAGMTCAPVR